MEPQATGASTTQLRRLSSQVLLNLRALIEATRFVDELLNSTNEQVIPFPQDQIPFLENSLHVNELLQIADQLTVKPSKAQQKQQRQIEMNPIQLATQFVQTLFNATDNSTGYVSHYFQNPVQSYRPNYYETVKHPMCYLFVATRLKQTALVQNELEPFSMDVEMVFNPLLQLKPSLYGSLLQQSESFSTLPVMTFTSLQKQISQVNIKPQPYTSFGELIADVLLIGANSVFYNPPQERLHGYGLKLLQDARNWLQTNKLFPSWAECLYGDELHRFVQVLNNKPVVNTCEFDTINLDDFSEQSLRRLVELMGLEDNTSTRETISSEMMQRACHFINEKIQHTKEQDAAPFQ